MSNALAYVGATWVILSVLLGLCLGRFIRAGAQPLPVDERPVSDAAAAFAAAVQASPEWNALPTPVERALETAGV